MANIKQKNQRDFRLYGNNTQASLDFNKIKVGKSTLSGEIAALIGDFRKSSGRGYKYSKAEVERAIENHNVPEMRRISEHFFYRSGIYGRLCRYMAFLYRYDWFITPQRFDSKIKDDKVIEGWIKASTYLDNCHLKRRFGQYALDVVKYGCYYGYILDKGTAAFLQQLPADYCRSRYEVDGRPAVEFNVKFFDDAFKDNAYKLRLLKSFPKEIQKAYISYKQGTLPKDFVGDDTG